MRTLYFICFSLVLVAPLGASAATAGFPEPTGVAVTENAVVFTTTTGFLSNSKSLRLPVFGSETERPGSFHYALKSELDIELVSVAFVVADAPIVDGAYQFAPGERAVATIVIIVPMADAAEALSSLEAEIVSWPLASLEEV
ncbi:hypothetical protein CL655_04115 [bacterium]|nr:hypothetical protein [bacterium]|tara:strand:+ start:1892 stop:2317 length:426 start_codon:yes stop_codon:yes gene_type:complete